MIKPSQRDSLLTIGGLLLLASGYYFLIYTPGRAAITKARRGVTEAQNAVREIPLKVAGLESLNREIERREEFLRLNLARIPQQCDAHTVISEFTQLAEGAKLKITRLEPSPQVTNNTYLNVPFTAILTGDFPASARFLAALEQHPRLFRVTDLTIDPEEEGERGVQEIEIKFSVCMLREKRSDFTDKNDSSGILSVDAKIR